MAKLRELTISHEECWEVRNLATGVFAPLTGFLKWEDYQSVVDTMRLVSGAPWTIPITLDVPEVYAIAGALSDTLILRTRSGEAVAELTVEDVFRVDVRHEVAQVFGTRDEQHPGVARELARSPWRVGGTIRALEYRDQLFPEHTLTPAGTRQMFQERGWKTITGFQTRNAIHRAHEYLQRIALEVTDGLFIQPLIGWKKPDDMSPLAVVRSYEAMCRQFYAPARVVFGLLKTTMRYAGPREAVFHALIRRNFGCTHFIVGRDHAGVGAYYEKYAAQELCAQFTDLGIQILSLRGPYYCSQCVAVVTEKTCPHGEEHQTAISGTSVRSQLQAGKRPPPHLMRPEVADVLLELAADNQLFNGQVDAKAYGV